MKSQKEMYDCPWCGQPTRLEFVQGHYECTSCRRPVKDCCDGERGDREISDDRVQEESTTIGT